MNLSDITRRGVPQPWSEGDNIPWNEPGFSQRMLQEHLSQQHDAASRRFETIDRHVRFLFEQVLGGRPSRVLDLGCGPGLYAIRLARLGCEVYGVDFSPASIAYARQQAAAGGLSCTFELSDLRAASFGSSGHDPGAPFDFAMLIYGEFNVFCPQDARLILSKVCQRLRPGGILLLEPHPEEIIRRLGSRPAAWSARESGLFSAQPHLLLSEAFWDETARAATHRYMVIDAQTAEVTRYAASYQAYSLDEYRDLLGSAGFTGVRSFPSLTWEEESGDFIVLTAVRGAYAA